MNKKSRRLRLKILVFFVTWWSKKLIKVAGNVILSVNFIRMQKFSVQIGQIFLIWRIQNTEYA
jgi:hypothetical protein